MSMFVRQFKRGLSVVVALLGITLIQAPASAVSMEPMASTTNKLTFGGDFRMRYESFINKTLNQPDRQRLRMRLRFGAKMEMDKWDAVLRLATGTGEQTSTNQTFTNGFNQKSINLDQAYATYKPWEPVKISGGKMQNPFWRVYSGDIVWDSDINPEGVAEQFSFDPSDMVNVFANFGQLPMFENSGSYKDPWLYGNQVGVQTKLGGGVRWNFAIADYHASYEESSVLVSTSAFSNDPSQDQPVVQGDNRRNAANSSQLVGGYHMLNFTTEVGFQLLVPIRLQGDFVRNVASNRVNNQNMGYQAGIILGSAKTAKSWEFGYFNKYVEANATISDFADSDWGNGGTNRKGHIVWLAFCPTDFLTIQTKYFMTRRADPTVGVSAPYAARQAVTYRDINRLQLDAVIKF